MVRGSKLLPPRPRPRAEDGRRFLARKRLLGFGFTPTRVFANLGRRHPDYGMTPQEHAANK